MSTLRVSNVADTSGNNSSTPAAIANGIAKAWVNFNGTGTVAIRASYNVSSITDNGAGDYTVNFTNALVDTNYQVSTSFRPFGGSNPRAQGGPITYATTSLRLLCGSSDTGNLGDTDAINVAIFR